MKPYSTLYAWMGALRRSLAARLLVGAQGAPAPQKLATTEQRARDLVRAIDAGGLPLNPAVVNHIARELGLEVSVHAPMAQTVERIRKALESL